MVNISSSALVANVMAEHPRDGSVVAWMGDAVCPSTDLPGARASVCRPAWEPYNWWPSKR